MKQFCVIFATFLIAMPLMGAATEDFETGYVPPPSKIPVQRGPFIEALKQARADDDMDLVNWLEAQIPFPEQVGENTMAPYVPRISATMTGDGEPAGAAAANGNEAFGQDIKVTSPWPDDVEREPSMASDSAGNLYLAWQDDDDLTGLFRIDVYKSTNGGTSWSFFNSVSSPYSLESPSVAVGEGAGRNLLLVVYVVDDQTNPRYIEVATAPLTGGSFAVHAVTLPVWDYYTPVIWTDSHTFNTWYAYMTAEAVVGGVSTNRNVTFNRSTDGTTWDTYQVLWGNSDSLTWIDPNGTFGTSARDQFVVCYNDSDDTLYLRQAFDFGLTFEPEVALASPYVAMGTEVDPAIAASIDDTTLMIGLTWRFSSSTTDDFAYMYSSDTAATWAGPYINHATSSTQRGVAVTANEGGHSFHFAWTDSTLGVVRATRSQDLAPWTTNPQTVSDATAEPSISYPTKGIASHWQTDEVGIAWADFRLGLPIYEIYYDASEPGLGVEIFSDGFESGNTIAWN